MERASFTFPNSTTLATKSIVSIVPILGTGQIPSTTQTAQAPVIGTTSSTTVSPTSNLSDLPDARTASITTRSPVPGTFQVSTTENTHPALATLTTSSQRPVATTLDSKTSTAALSSTTSLTKVETSSNLPALQPSGNAAALSTITASPVLATTTRTFASQQFTAVNSLTGYIEIEPAPAASRELPKSVEPSSNSGTSNAVETTKLPKASPAPVQISPTEATTSVPRFTLTNTNLFPPASTATDNTTPPNLTTTIVIDVSSITAIRPSPTKTSILVPSNTPIAAPTEQYKLNLADAKKYMNFFKTLTAESACTLPFSICITGKVTTCDEKTKQPVMRTCEANGSCFAMPNIRDPGVTVDCFGAEFAKALLELDQTTTSTTPVAIPTSTASVLPTVTGAQSSIDLGLIPLPTPSKQVQPAPSAEPIASSNDPVTVTTNVSAPTPTVYVTLSRTTVKPGQTPTKTAGVVYTIVPIPETTNSPTALEKKKETVTVTVTKTERA